MELRPAKPRNPHNRWVLTFAFVDSRELPRTIARMFQVAGGARLGTLTNHSPRSVRSVHFVIRWS